MDPSIDQEPSKEMGALSSATIAGKPLVPIFSYRNELPAAITDFSLGEK